MKKIALIGAAAVLLAAAAIVFLLRGPEPEPPTAAPYELLADGIGHFDRGELELALEVLRQVPNGSIEKPEALYYEGSAHIMRKDYRAAVTSLEQALALESRNTGVLYALGVAWFKLGDVSLAKGYFSAVLDIDPNDEQAKGLMEIMTGLERQSDAESGDGESPESQ